jgi:hypothetical protein
MVMPMMVVVAAALEHASTQSADTDKKRAAQKCAAYAPPEVLSL